jgi:hypothetical protein
LAFKVYTQIMMYARIERRDIPSGTELDLAQF